MKLYFILLAVAILFHLKTVRVRASDLDSSSSDDDDRDEESEKKYEDVQFIADVKRKTDTSPRHLVIMLFLFYGLGTTKR